MKKILLIMVMLVGLCGVNTLNATTQREQQTDSLRKEIVAMVSTKLDSINSAQIKDSIKSMLNDTIISKKPKTVDGTYSFSYESDKPEYELALVMVSVITPFVTIVLIVFLCLLMSYKKRKKRYEMIEKAIEKDYVIPEYLLSDDKQKNVCPPSSGNGSNGSKVPYMPNQWAGVKSGAILAAVGIGLVFAFGFNFMGGLCSILFFIGVAKIVVNILEQRHIKEYYQDYDMGDSDRSKSDWNNNANTNTGWGKNQPRWSSPEKPKEGTVPPPYPNDDQKHNS